ncbi:DUF3037 domain-containing protein [Sphingomonas sp. AAP5]|uniref:DUF3037 domain-containing protein n=1 Tax=Sphingomonas sp. AAP5 TaxID=1523415 RepID=UPI0010570C45|nr:DUF3037 domain-containing protein [Sphingomonas sp. AAP5]QBM77414.1 DUF3037 domain-containing protein [Sphingomonas sp. AAP5]
MKSIFKYSIIRFRPFAETEEFANIGVIAIDEASGEIAFEIGPKRFSRIRHFFDEKAYHAYAHVIEHLAVELPRMTQFLTKNYGVSSRSAFEDITKRRESSVIFSAVRLVNSDLNIETLTENLFNRFVKREFAADNIENVLTRDIRRSLHQYGVRNFKNFKIDDDLIPVSFPLAHLGQELRAIKPLAFSQKSPMGIVDYGAHWRKRLSYLLDRKKVGERNVLIAVDGPGIDAEKPMREAFDLARDELARLPFDIVDGEVGGVVNEKIIAFARASLPWQVTLPH